MSGDHNMYQKPSIKVDGVDLVAEVEMLKRLLLQAQPEREWQGLTEEDIAILWKATPLLIGVYSYTDIAREVEAKLKEKNGG